MDLLLPGVPERTYADFVKSLTLAEDTQQAQAQYASAEQQLLSAAVSYRRYRTWTRWLGVGLAGTFGTALGADLATREKAPTPFAMAFYATPIVVGGVLFFESLFPTTTERMAELWKNDPSFIRSQRTSGLRVTPVFGVLSAGITGAF